MWDIRVLFPFISEMIASFLSISEMIINRNTHCIVAWILFESLHVVCACFFLSAMGLS